MQTVHQLSEQFAIEDEVWFEELAEEYPVVRIKNAYASASIALHGAHLTNFQPADQEPVIFTSQAAIFREGKAIRGGIPVCWPWFGAHPDKQPSHGYARISFWALEHVENLEDVTQLKFSLAPQAKQTNSNLSATLEFHIGKDLQLTLQTRNLGDQTETFSEALHNYFHVTDSRQTHVHGLDGASYIDTTGEESTHTQQGPVEFTGETDRIYHSDRETVIEDLVSQRRIHVTKTGSQSTVVWNPGQDKGSAMGDLLDEEIHHFVCVESANVRNQSITPPAGETHALHLTISTAS